LKKVSFLFWNTNRRPLLNLVSTIVHEYEIDVLILAECEIPLTSLLTELNTNEAAKFSAPPNPSAYFTILVRFPSDSLQLVRDIGGMSIRRLAPPIGNDLLFVALHLQSKLFSTEAEQSLFCTRLIKYIEEAEEAAGHRRTIVLGDLNMNPFESGVVGAEGFHAVMDRRIAERGKRKVQGQERRFFYNPMWSYLGDASVGPAGTYYYYGSGQISYFWNMFDQVLIRPDLLSRFDDEDVKVLSSAGSISLLSAQQIPDRRAGSDHLPILFRIDLKEIST
jgi:hypothetical protein